MNENSIFDIKRFRAELLRTIASDRRRIVLSLIVLVSVMVFFTMYIHHSFSQQILFLGEYGRDIMRLNVPHSILTFYSVVLYVAGCVGASMMLVSMRSKQGRIELLSMPSSMIEKYLAQWITYVLGTLVVFVLSAALCDLLRVVIFSMVPSSGIGVTSIWQYWHEREVCGDEVWYMPLVRDLWEMMAVYVAVTSFFCVGAVLWSGNNMIKTVGALTLGVIALGVWGTVWVMVFNSHFSEIFDIYPSLGKYWVWLLFYVMGLFNWWVCYRGMVMADIMPHVSLSKVKTRDL